jgi:hypothetical protein
VKQNALKAMGFAADLALLFGLAGLVSLTDTHPMMPASAVAVCITVGVIGLFLHFRKQ